MFKKRTRLFINFDIINFFQILIGLEKVKKFSGTPKKIFKN